MAARATGSHCPVCGAVVDTELRRLFGRALRRCRCGHCYLDVGEVSAEILYNDHYTGFREDPVFRREATRVLAEEIRPHVPPPGTLLDVGCGNGEFLAIARAAGYSVTGIDVSRSAQELGRIRGLDVRLGDLRTSDAVASHERFDLVTFWDVVEHLPDPRSFLRRAYELMQPGGHLLVKTPRTSSLSVRLSSYMPRAAGALLQAPSHVQYFGREGLARMLRETGFGEQRWLDARPMRSQATGGRLRRRLTRAIAIAVRSAAGDGNFLVLARRENSA